MNAVPKIDLKEHIRKLQPTPQDPWDSRPCPDCLSIRDVVNIFRSGLTETYLYHLSKCEADRKWIYNYAKMAAIPAPASQLRIWENIKVWLGVSSDETLTKTPLYVLDKNVQVGKVEEPISIEIALVGGFPLEGTHAGPEDIDLQSLKLEGALCAHGAATVVRREIRPNVPGLVVRFNNALLAGESRKGISEHALIFDSVKLRGRLAAGEKTSFLGQADVRFIRTARS
jgi:hypothetical protein